MKHKIRVVLVLFMSLLLGLSVVNTLRATAMRSTVSLENRKQSVQEDITKLRMTSVVTAGNARAIAINGTYAYIGADARLLVFDIAIPTDPQFITETTLTAYPIEEISVVNNYVYVANAHGGVRVISLANPALPVEVGHTDGVTSVSSVAIAGNYVYATGIDFNVIDVSNIANPNPVGAIVGHPAHHVVVQGDYAYTSGDNQFGVITITNPLLPELAGVAYEYLKSYDFEIAGNYAYLAEYNDGLVITSIITPTLPYVMGSVYTNGIAQAIAVFDGYAYVCSQNYSLDGTGYLEKISITNPTTPAVVKATPLAHVCHDIVVHDGHLYVVTNVGLSVFAADTLRVVGAYPPDNRVYLPVLYTNFGKCLTSPTLLTPTNGAQLDTLIPTFWWDNGSYPNAERIRVQIATDPQMSVKIISFSGNHPGSGQAHYTFSINFSPGTTHYWQAYFECDGGFQSPFSDVWSFTTGSEGTLLPPPSLKAPANSTTLTTNAVTLEWNPVPEAVAYIVSYRPTGETWSIIQTEIDPQAEIDNLQSATTYEWWVRVRNDYGYSEDSEKWQFTTPTSAATSSSSALHKIKLVLENGVIHEVED